MNFHSIHLHLLLLIASTIPPDSPLNFLSIQNIAVGGTFHKIIPIDPVKTKLSKWRIDKVIGIGTEPLSSSAVSWRKKKERERNGKKEDRMSVIIKNKKKSELREVGRKAPPLLEAG